ncbi:TMEM165/GDT1 family protein [Pseudokineococcus sp. 1T1Z-3]|uniref:TMEM165/GDT1 family protein n=1 Tax=Pseudokineococcus sp. 1T1Z-3 TaxID=3132745 RepID=UPI00309BAE45
MDDFFVATAIATGVVVAAELGDKSQLMALTFATRYRPAVVLAAVAVATALLNLASVLLGAAVGSALPTTAVGVVAGLLFVGFGVWTLRPGAEEGGAQEEDGPARAGRSAFVTVLVSFLLAELGDKTMLATITLAARDAGLAQVAGTWLGATIGMVVASALAIVVGAYVGTRLPERAVRLGAGALFVLLGLWLLVETLVLG